MSDDRYPAWPDMLRWLNVLKDRVETIPAISTEQIVTGILDPSVMPGLTGDVTAPPGSIETTLATVNEFPGTYGDDLTIPIVTVNGKGLVTSITEDLVGSSFTAGSVVFANGTGLAEDNAHFFWDDTNNKLGIGTAAPAETVDIRATTAGLALVSPADIAYVVMANLGGLNAAGQIGIESATGGGLTTGSSPYATVVTNNGLHPIQFSTQDIVRVTIDSIGRIGIGTTSPTAFLHLKAGTATANTAPLKFTSGTNLTSAEAGAIEFTTDDYFATITTGAARKGIVLDNGARLTSGNIPVATTNGRLIDGPVSSSLVSGSGTTGKLPKWSAATALTDSVLVESASSIGVGLSPTSRLTLPAGSTTANTAPLEFASGALETTARVGVVEFLTDVWYGTITTGAARKGFVLDNGSRLTSGRIPFATTNGRLIDTSDLQYSPGGGGQIVFASGGGIIGSGAATLLVGDGNDTININGSAVIVTSAGRTAVGGTGVANALLQIAAGTATANTAPLKFTSGTNLTTAEAGAVEYNGTNLFFTRAGTVRENVLVAIDNVAAPTTSIGVAIVNFYGANATNYLGDPNRWLSVNVLGSTYRIPLYT